MLNNSDSLPQDEVTTTSNEFQYYNTLSYWDGITSGGWDWCCHYHEMDLWDTTGAVCHILDVDVSFKTYETLWGETWMDFSITPAIPHEWGQESSGTFVADENTSRLDGQRTLNPEKMTQDQIDELGIKQNTRDEIVTIDADGEVRSPDYIMTSNPFVNVQRR